MSLFSRLSPKVKNYYYKSLNYFWRFLTLLKYIILFCILQIIVFYLADLLIIAPENSEFLNITSILTAVTFPVTLIITSKMPIIRFRIYSRYRNGFNGVYGGLVIFIVLGVIAKMLPSINWGVIPIFVKETIHHFNFSKHTLLWFKHVLEIETFVGVLWIIFRIIWLSANPIKFRKNRSENIFRETELIIKSKNEATIESLISELHPHVETIIKLTMSKHDSKYALRLLELLLDNTIDDNQLFLHVALRKRLNFYRLILYTLIGEYKKNPNKINVRLHELILVNPIIAAFKIEDWMQDSALYSIAKIISDNLNASDIFLKKAGVSGWHNLLFKHTSVEYISATDYEKYIFFISQFFTPSITLEDLDTLLSDIDFLLEFFGSLYKRDNKELWEYAIAIISNQDDLIHIFESLVKVLHMAEYKNNIDIEVKNKISILIMGTLPDLILNMLAMLSRVSACGINGSSTLSIRFCKKLFDSLFKDTQLKDYHFGEETKRDFLSILSDTICRYFLNISHVKHFLIPENLTPLGRLAKLSEVNHLPLVFFFKLYPAIYLQYILDKDDAKLTGDEIVAKLIFYRMAEEIIESTGDDLPKTIQEFYLPNHIKHQLIDGKHYLIEMKDGVETKLALSYDFSK